MTKTLTKLLLLLTIVIHPLKIMADTSAPTSIYTDYGYNVNYLLNLDDNTAKVIESPLFFHDLTDKQVFAFDGAFQHREIYLLTEIGDRAFYGVEKTLEAFRVPSMVSRIGSEAFADGLKVSRLELSGGLQSIGDRAFANFVCDTLVINSYNPPTLGAECFTGASLGVVLVPESRLEAYRTAPGWSDFADKIQGDNLPFLLCNDMAYVINPDGNTISYVQNPSKYCNTIFEARGLGLFADYVEINGKKLYPTVIGPKTLMPVKPLQNGYRYIRYINQQQKLPQSIRRIENLGLSCFSECKILEIGPNVEYIGSEAISPYAGESINILYCSAENPPVVEDDFLDDSSLKAILTHNAEVYKNAPGWSRYAGYILDVSDLGQLPDGIGYRIKDDSSKIAITDEGATGDIVIPDITEIDGKFYIVSELDFDCFRDNKKITSITLPATITDIGTSYKSNTSQGYFSGCELLEWVKAPGVKFLGGYVFKDCSSLREVEFSSVSCTLDGPVFYNCYNLSNSGLKSRFTNIAFEPFTNTKIIITDEILKNVERLNRGFGRPLENDNVRLSNMTISGETDIETLSGRIESLILDNVTITYESFWDGSHAGRLGLITSEEPEYVILGCNYDFYGCIAESVQAPVCIVRETARFLDMFKTKIISKWQDISYLEAIELEQQQLGSYWASSLGDYIWFLKYTNNYYKYNTDWVVDNDGFIYNSEAKDELIFAPAKGDYELPSTIKTIHDNAFADGQKLKSVKFPEGVTSLPARAFEYCRALESVKLPESLTHIGEYAFSDCSSLKSIILPSSGFSCSSRAFSNTAIKDLYFPEGTYVWDFLLGNYERITNVPGIRIAESMLSAIYQRNTQSVKLDSIHKKVAYPDGASAQGPISEIYDPSGKKTLGVRYPQDAVIDSNYVYSVSRDKLIFAHAGIDLKVGPQVNEIYQPALQNSGKIGKLTLAASPMALAFPEGALLGTEPDEFESDRDWTYAGSDAMFSTLKSVILGKNVRSVPANSFSGSEGLTRIVSMSVDAPKLDPSAFSDDQYATLTPELPDSIDSYLALSNGWRRFKSLSNLVTKAEGTMTTDHFEVRPFESGWEIVGYIGDPAMTQVIVPAEIGKNGKVLSIAPKAFAGNTEIETVTIPDGVRSVGKMAFADCEALSKVYGLENVDVIEAAAFQNCLVLDSLGLENVRHIGPAAFENCKKLKTITLGESIERIGQSAFEGCTSLSAIDLSKCLNADIAAGAFRGCTALKSIEIGAGVRSIGFEAFVGSGLTSLAFAEGSTLQTIGDRAFYQLRARGSLSLPASVERIGASAFEYARMLTDVILPDNLNLSIGDNAFRTCERLASVTWPAEIRSIGASAFEKTVIGQLDINVDSIGYRAFAEMPSLNSVKLGDRLLYIGAEAFHNSGVTSLILPTVDSADATIQLHSNTFINDDNSRTLTHVELGNKVKLIGDCAMNVNGYIDFGSSIEQIGSGNGFAATEALILPASLNLIKSEISAPAVNMEYSPNKLTIHECNIVARDIYVDRNTEFPSYNTNHGFKFSSPDSLNIVYSDHRSLELELNSYSFYAPQIRLHVGASVKSLNEINVDKVTFSDGIESLAARSLTTLQKSLRLPSSLKSIAEGAIESKYSYLEELIIGDSPEPLSMEQNSVSGLENLKSVYIGRDIKTSAQVVPFTLANVTSLQKACFGENTTRVPDNMFRNCTSLTNVILPDNITMIGSRAYMGCTALDVLSISAKIAGIGDEAYRDCTGLNRIVARGLTPPAGNAGFGATVEDNVMLYVPEAAFDDYTASDLFYAFANVSTHNDKIVESVVTDANLREVEPGQTIDIVKTYGLEVNLVGEGSRSYGSRKAKGRTVSANSDTDLSHTFYWFSTNPDAASVTQDGVVTIHNDRAAEIWAVVLDGSDQKARIGINNIVLGDSNDDGFVTVTDAVNTANYAVGNEVNNFFFRSADVNKDKEITLSDASGTISILLGQNYGPRSFAKAQTLKAKAQTGDHLLISDYKANAGESAMIDVLLENTTGYVALQADVEAPEGMTLEGVIAGPRAAIHKLSAARINERTMRVVLFTPSNVEFSESDEPLFSLNVKVNDLTNGSITMTNVLASDADANEYRLAINGGVNGDSTSGIGNVDDEAVSINVTDRGVTVCNAEGRRVAVYTTSGMTVANFTAASDFEQVSLSSGMYIVMAGTKVEKVIIK